MPCHPYMESLPTFWYYPQSQLQHCLRRMMISLNPRSETTWKSINVQITSICYIYKIECFSFHQRTPLDVAVERGYVEIAEHFRGTGMSEVSIWDTTARSIFLLVVLLISVWMSLILRPPMRWCCIDEIVLRIITLFLFIQDITWLIPLLC